MSSERRPAIHTLEEVGIAAGQLLNLDMEILIFIVIIIIGIFVG